MQAISKSIFVYLLAVALFAGLSHAQDEPPKHPDQEPKSPILDPQKRERFAEIVADIVNRKHGGELWRRKSAIQFNLEIAIKDQPTIQGTLTYEISRGRIRFDDSSGGSIIVDGNQSWTTSSDVKVNADQLRTWTYIAVAPFRLRERGVQPTAYRILPLGNDRFDSFQLQPKNDSPLKNTLTAYSHPRQHFLHGLAGMQLTSQEAPVQAVVYGKNEAIEAITIAHTWTIFNWDNNLQGDSIGSATLTNVHFVTPADGTFDKPPDPAK